MKNDILKKAMAAIDNVSKKINKKTFIFLAVSTLLPLLLLLVFFYGNFNLKNIYSNMTASDKTENYSEESFSLKNLSLQLIPRNKFVEKYNPKPAFLPRPIQLQATLSGFLKSNTSMELLPVRNWAVPFADINASSAIAIEMPTKRILYGKNVFEVRPVASLSKLITAMVVYETLNLDEIVTISQKAVQTEGNAASLVAGEQLTVEQLLYALLLESSNDAAVGLQEHYDSKRLSSQENFVQLMNTKARELGLNDATFEEPSGLSEYNQTSANGVAKMLYEAYQNPTIARIISSSSHITSPNNKDITHYWINLNTLLEAYDGIIGGKTGYTEEAGPSMSIIITTPNEGRYVIIVVLNAEDRVEETTNLLKWIREAYIWEE